MPASLRSFLLLCAGSAALIGSPVRAECTAAEATSKAEELAAKVKDVTREDPQRAEELHEELEQMRLKTDSAQLDDACEAYEQRIRELDKAAERTE